MAKTILIPGFRFHPTDVELVKYFLKRKVIGKKFPLEVIAEVDVYKYAPWDLPDKSLMSTSMYLEWYFFCPRAKKYTIGGRMKRSTEVGYWKTTGRDKSICHNNQNVGLMKVLVFHMGRQPKGHRTDWVMHEYRLDDKDVSNKGIAQDSYVLCRVFKKDGCGGRNNNGGQRGTLFDEEIWDYVEDSISIIADHEPLQILPTISQHNNKNLSPRECNWSLTPKSSSLSLDETHNPLALNKEDAVCQIIPCNEDDALCLLDYFTEEELHNMLPPRNKDNNIEAGVNSEEKKESEGTPFADIFRDLEELNNLDDALDDEAHVLTQACVNSEEKKESEGTPFAGIFRDLEELNNLDDALDDEAHVLTQVGFPTKPYHSQ